LLPSLPPLDTAEGGRAVVRLAEIVDAELVVIDTFARAVEGDENEADTVRNLYRWTGLHLKHAGRAFVRVDHAGKDLAKGQRGTSAKNDDVDVVWQMTAKDRGGYQLVAKKRRMGWVPEHVNLELSEGGRLAFNLAEGVAYPAGTVDVVNELDRLGVPVELSATKATKAYRAAGGSARNEVLRAAQRYRQRRSVDSYLVGDEAMATARQPVDNIVDKPVDNSGRGAGRGTSETGRGAVGRGDPLETAKPQLDDRAPQIGARWGAVGAVTGARCGPPNGATRPPPGPDEHSDDVDNLPW